MSWSYVFLGFLVAAMLAGVTLLAREVRSKHLMIWLGSYIRKRAVRSDSRKSPRREAPVHVLFCMVDHFEPISAGSTKSQERQRMRDWLDRYPLLDRKSVV